MGYKIPTETTARTYVLNYFAKENFTRLKNILNDKKIFLIVDEGEVAGTIEEPDKKYILDVIPLPESVSLDNSLVISYFESCLTKFDLKKENVLLLISDAARYMVKAVTNMKTTFPTLFHLTCIAHLIHNCSLKVKATYEKVDKCISSVKAIVCKNRTNMEYFTEIGRPPEVIVTRWSSWLKGALYYTKNLPAVKTIVNGISSTGLLIDKAKNAVNQEGLDKELLEIKECYECLIDILDKLEDSKFSIGDILPALETLNLKEDPINLKKYIEERLKSNDIVKINKMDNSYISPESYAYLKTCPPTSIAVERSFSMLKKMLAADRNFKETNVY